MSTTCYKAIGANGESWFGGGGVWSLPTLNDAGTYTPGDWMPEIADVVLCRSGYHYCAGESQLLFWLGPAIYILEPGPVIVPADDMHVTNTARLIRPITSWNKRTALLFAADCAEHVLPIYEQNHPDDRRPREAIEATRAFANGDITAEELAVASEAAWGCIARHTSWDAAGNAAYAAWATSTGAILAALAAARGARDTRFAETGWQADRLRFYLTGGEA